MVLLFKLTDSIACKLAIALSLSLLWLFSDWLPWKLFWFYRRLLPNDGAVVVLVAQVPLKLEHLLVRFIVGLGSWSLIKFLGHKFRPRKGEGNGRVFAWWLFYFNQCTLPALNLWPQEWWRNWRAVCAPSESGGRQIKLTSTQSAHLDISKFWGMLANGECGHWQYGQFVGSELSEGLPPIAIVR